MGGFKTLFFRDGSKRRTGGPALRIRAYRAYRDGSVRRFGTACFERFAYMDVGGRAMQEQLPRPEAASTLSVTYKIAYIVAVILSILRIYSYAQDPTGAEP